MYHKTKILLILSLIIFTAGCSTYSGDFKCKANGGIHCKSVSDVNKIVNKNELDLYSDKKSSKSRKINQYYNKPEFKNKVAKPIKLGFWDRLRGKKQPLPEFSITNSAATTYGDTVIRTPEYTLRVWVAPYEAKNGNYMAERIIHTVISKAAWQPQNKTAVMREKHVK